MRIDSRHFLCHASAARCVPLTPQNRALDYEIRSTRNGVSANHLLNFSLPEREKQVFTKKKKSGPTRTQNEFLHAKWVDCFCMGFRYVLTAAYTAGFLMRSFRFVIAPLEDDASTPFWDMEALTEWTSVEQVLLWYDEANPMSCPICLDDFRAPKITKCGHIFCWPCILRYLSLTEKYWRRCPMCFDSVQKGQLRSVRLEKVNLPPRVDSDATFQFLQRSKSSFFPHLPTAQHGSTGTGVSNKKRVRKLPSVYDPAATYSRILESTREYLTHILMDEMRDLEALDAEFRSSGDVDSLPFVEEAMRATSGRLAQNDSGKGQGSPDNDSNRSGVTAQGSKADSGSEVYSFYQLANGIYVVLHPLNMKCLLKEFAEPKAKEEDEVQERDEVSAAWAEASSLSSASSSDVPAAGVRYDLLPERIHGRVLDVEHVVMDDEMQKRYRFLSHLPKFCDFYLCELDLSELLSPATVGAFRGEIKKRERQRKQKQKSKQSKSANSPIYKGAMSGFSLEQEGMAWPAPAEMSLSDAFEESASLTDHQNGDEHDYHHHVGLESASPQSPYFGAYDEGSFATITRQSGYYPPLSRAGSSDASAPAAAAAFGDYARGSPSAWGVASSPPPLFDVDLDSLPRKGKGGKKGSGKKGVSLFSTSQQRSYR